MHVPLVLVVLNKSKSLADLDNGTNSSSFRAETQVLRRFETNLVVLGISFFFVLIGYKNLQSL